MLDFMIATPKRHILARNRVFWNILRQNRSRGLGCNELYCGKQSCPGKSNRGSRLSAWRLMHCARSKLDQVRSARYKSSRTLVGKRRRSSVFERKRTRTAVWETAKISENSEMSEIVHLDSTSRSVETWRLQLIVDEQRIRYRSSSAAISLRISLWFNCGQAFLVWCDVDCREAAQRVSDERGLSERSGLVRHSDGQPAEDVFIRVPVPWVK